MHGHLSRRRNGKEQENGEKWAPARTLPPSPKRPHFAPLRIPLGNAPHSNQIVDGVERRLQTLAVLMFLNSPALFLAAFFFLCAIPLLWPVL